MARRPYVIFMKQEGQGASFVRRSDTEMGLRFNEGNGWYSNWVDSFFFF